MPSQMILLSDMLNSQRKYRSQLRLLFNKFKTFPRKKTRQNEIITLDNNQQVQLDRPIERRTRMDSKMDARQEQQVTIKLDIYANEQISSQHADHEFSNVEFVISESNKGVTIKPKKRLVRPIYGAARAVRDTAMIKLFYPFKTKSTPILPKADVGAINQTPLPQGKILHDIMLTLDRNNNHEERLQIALSLLDAVETLQHMGIRHLHLSPHNMMYDGKRITILNYHHARNIHDPIPQLGQSVSAPILPSHMKSHAASTCKNEADLAEVPSFPVYVAPEVLGHQSSAKSDNYSVGIIFAQLCGLTKADIEIIGHNSKGNFIEQMTLKMQQNKLFPPAIKNKFIEITEKLLAIEPEERIEISEAKKELYIVAASCKQNASYHVHDTKLKQSFFMSVDTTHITENPTALVEPLYHKVSIILQNLPWQKASRLGGVPKSIQFMRDIVGAMGHNMNANNKLTMLQLFCKKNATMSEWKRKLRGRHDITHELITILAEIKTTPIPQMVDKLDTLHKKFNIAFDSQPAPIRPAHQLR